MNNELKHYGVSGMKWGVRRYQNEDGTLTAAGRKKYDKKQSKAERAELKLEKSKSKLAKNYYENVKRYNKDRVVYDTMNEYLNTADKYSRAHNKVKRLETKGIVGKRIDKARNKESKYKKLYDQSINALSKQTIEYGKDRVLEKSKQSVIDMSRRTITDGQVYVTYIDKNAVEKNSAYASRGLMSAFKMADYERLFK